MGDSAALELLMTLKDEASEKLEGIKGHLGGVNLSAVALGGAAVAGVGLLAAGLYDAGQAAAEEEVGIARLKAAVEASGEEWGAASDKIETYLAAELKRTALDDGEGRASLARLTTVTKDSGEAMKLLGVAQDMAAAKGIDLKTATEAVGKVYMGNSMILKQYGIDVKATGELEKTAEAAAKVNEKAMEAYGVAHEKVNKIQKEMATATGPALLKLQKDLIKAKEDETEKSAAYKTSYERMNEAFAEARSEIEQNGTAMDQLTRAVKGQAQAFGETGVAAQQRFDIALGNIKETIGGYVLPVMTQFLGVAFDLATRVLPLIPVAVQFITDHLPAFTAGLIALSVGIGIAVIPSLIAMAAAAWAAIAPVLVMAAPIIAVAVVIGLLAEAWASDWGGIRTVITDVWEGTLKPIFEGLITWFTVTLPAGLQAGVQWVNTALDNIRQIFEWAFGLYLSIVTGVLDLILGVFGTDTEAMALIISDWLTNTLTTVTDMWDTISYTIRTFLASIGHDVEVFIAGAISALTAGWTAITGTARGAWEGFRNMVGTILNGLGLDVGGWANGLGQILDNAWIYVVESAMGMWTGLKNNIANMFVGLHIATPHISIQWQDVPVLGHIPSGLSVDWYARGGNFLATGPMIIGVGEAGPERVSITPVGQNAGNSSAITINYYDQRPNGTPADIPGIARRLQWQMAMRGV